MENLQFRVTADSEYSFTNFIAIVRRRKGTMQKLAKERVGIFATITQHFVI